jgi:hypothetical protein
VRSTGSSRSGVAVQHRRCVCADAEKRRAGEIENAGIAELHIESERRHRVEQHRVDQQQHEMIFVKECCNGECGDDRASAERILMICKGCAHAVEDAKPCAGDHHGDAGGEQRDDEILPFDIEQRDQIGGRDYERDHARPHRAARFFRNGPRRAH